MSTKWFLLVVIGLAGCGQTGACHGYSPLFDEDYCHDGWNAAECDEWNDEEVNGANWNFHGGQTCAERGV